MSTKNSNRDHKKFFFSALLLLLLLLTNTFSLNAQQHATVSPYSRYGIGILAPSAFVSQTGMGGIGIASYAPERINFSNPASYAYDTITAIEAGIKGELSQLTTATNSQSSNSASISYLAIGFPVIKNKWGASFGVMPYSSVGYHIVAQQTTDPLGKVNYVFQGNGALSRFYLGNAYAPFGKLSQKFYASDHYKKMAADKDTVRIKRITNRNTILKGLSIGFNASWLFGSINQIRAVEFAEAPTTYNTKINSQTSLSGAYLNFGLLYSYISKKQTFFNVGFTGAASTNINTSTNALWYNYTSVGGAFESIADTVQVLTEVESKTTIPVYYSAGIATGKKDKWMIEANYTQQDWKKFKSTVETTPLNTSYTIAIGGEYIPNKKGFNYLQKIQYRLGGHYSKTYVSINNSDVKNLGIAFGFGLPIINKDRIQKATFQLGVEAGQEGTKENNLLRQQFVRFHLGVTLNELWFLKRKYD